MKCIWCLGPHHVTRCPSAQRIIHSHRVREEAATMTTRLLAELAERDATIEALRAQLAQVNT